MVLEDVMMKLPRRQFLQLAAGAAALPLASRMAGAQGFPSRPVTIVVATGVGGPSDLIARVIAESMRASLGQPVIIENAGGIGTVGMDRVARAKPDGHTLAFSASFSTHVVHGAIHKLPYDIIDNFNPVALVTESPQVILTKKALPANDLKGLIGWLKANPDTASLGQTGPGSPAHVTGLLFQKLTGTRFLFANYRSAGQAMQDLIAGHIDLMFVAPNIALEHVRAGSIKAYAVTDRSRLAAAPDVPTVDEAGLPGFYAAPWHALWAPGGTPPEVIARLNAAVMDALADEGVRKRLGDLGLTIVSRERQTPEALATFQRAEIERWWPILKEAGVKAQ
jgi:tripartite-type tricarboxylate transporter receptor subunit TctC